MPRQKTLNNNEFALLKCKICEKAANGRHYEVDCCFSCKTFFRRAVLNRQTTDCVLNEFACTNSKKLCRGCRFKKCLKMGMSKSALQPKRDIIGIIRRPASDNSNDNLTDIEKQHLELITRLIKLDNNIRIKKFEIINSKKAAKRLADQLRGVNSVENEDDLQLMAKSDVSVGTQIDLLAMIEWTTTIDVFSKFPIKDRAFLIKRFSPQYLALENGFFTAQNRKEDNIYQISIGSYMPRDSQMLKDKNLLPARLWRQEKLWSNMVAQVLDGIVNPLRKFNILPQEMLALKILILFNCGNHSHEEDNTLPIEPQTREKMIEFKNQIILALFAFYKSKNYPNYPQRFANMTLMISGILSAANTLLETYQIMRIFGYAEFDHLVEKMLFGTDEINKLTF